jgi:ribosomal 50S subunit-associated protein YjgA (DUF615 family)
MTQELRSANEAKILATQLREVGRMSLDEFSLDRDIVEAIVLARLLADGEDDIAEGRTRPFRLFFREFHKKS